ncbi:MAG: hypothetical protein HGA87_00575 [Desulfobulbaceae bacterium]|nr:hypothetical protein [Desulfobulbaceae bacterium]
MSEHLVYAMSTLGETSIVKFNDIFKRLSPAVDERDHDYNVRFQTVRYLDALGYCEFDYDGRRVFMCPPALVLLPSFGLPRALLTGARTPGLVEKIKASVKNRKNNAVFQRFKQKNPDLDLPDVTVIEATDLEVLKAIALENGTCLNSDRPAAWDLATHSASVDSIESGLHFESKTEINWARRDFNIQRLAFSQSNEASAYRLSEYINPDNQQRKHWIWNGAMAAEVARDWGRYIALKQADKKILIYDEETQELLVPLRVPLPCLLARSATLCSGMAPVIQKNAACKEVPDDCSMQIYSDVPSEIAAIILAKTGQDFNCNRRGGE